MSVILRHIDIHGNTAAQALVRPPGVVFEFPEFQPIFPLLRIDKLFPIKEFFVVRAIAAFHNPILPRTSGTDSPMQQMKVSNEFFERTLTIPVEAQLHREFVGVVGPDEKKGGSISNARLSTPATVEEARLS